MTAASRAALLSVVPLLVVAACGKKDAAPASSAAATTASASAGAKGDADLADVQSYELTMDKVDKYFAVQRNLANKVKAMSPAERKAAMAHKDDDNDEDSGKSDDIDGMARKIDSQPQLAAAIREAGLSSREFAVMTLALMQSGMAASVMKMRPKDDPDSLARAMKANPANVRFYREHEAELTRRTNEMKAEMKAVAATSDE